jgi:uncharacterized protein (UPF0303 family)
LEDILEQLLWEERAFQFASFNESTAWQLSSQLVERANKAGLPQEEDHKLVVQAIRDFQAQEK